MEMGLLDWICSSKARQGGIMNKRLIFPAFLLMLAMVQFAVEYSTFIGRMTGLGAAFGLTLWALHRLAQGKEGA